MKLDINTEHFIICWEVGTTIYLIQWYILKYTTDETYIDVLPKGSNSIMYNIDLNILEVLFRGKAREVAIVYEHETVITLINEAVWYTMSP